ncbi:MAG: histidine kinase, partial [Bacteroidota bacterium]
AVSYLNKFSKILREVLKHSESKEYSLQAEIDTLKLYMNLENIRFETPIHFTIENEQDLNLSQFRIPPLLLQPFLENSIWHGLSLRKGIKNLIVRIRQENEDHILIEVEDNGIGREAAMEIKSKKVFQRESLGLKLSSDRLKLFAQQRQHDHSMEIIDLHQSGEPSGTLIRLEVPIH